LQANAMSTDVSWANSAEKYVSLYRAAMGNHADSREYSAAAADPNSW
jgi:glycogen synthase